MNTSRCIFGKKSAIRHFIINRAYFFFLWPGFHWLVWKFLMVFTTILTWKTWKPLVVFMKLENQKIETWGIRLLDHRWYSWNAFLPAAGVDRLRFAPAGGPLRGRVAPSDRRPTRIGGGQHPRRAKKRFMKPPMVQEPKPQVSIYLIFEFHETTKGFKFSCQNSRETIKNFQTSQWNQVTKKKCAVSILNPHIRPLTQTSAYGARWCKAFPGSGREK